MFNRKIEMKVVKDTKQETTEKQSFNTDDFVRYYALARMVGKDIAVGAAAVVAVYKTFDALSEIAVHTAKTNIK